MAGGRKNRARAKVKVCNNIVQKQGVDFVEYLPPPLLLYEIFPRLDPTTRVRAAAVSTSWRDLSRRAPPPADCGIPCIWLSNRRRHLLLRPPAFSSPSSHGHCGRTTTTGSTFQYLFLVSPPSVLLYDPFARRSIPLIPFPPHFNCHLSCFPPVPLSSPNQAMPSNFVAMAVSGLRLYLYHPVKRDWLHAVTLEKALCDLIFHQQSFYFVDHQRQINALDTNCESVAVRVVVPPRDVAVDPLPMGIHWPNKPVVYYYLLHSCINRDLLLVTRYDLDYKMVKFTVHRVEEERLLYLNDVGDMMLFVREGCSRSSRNPPCPMSSSQFFTTNSIYFFHKDIREQGTPVSYSLGKFSLGNNSSDNFATFHPISFHSRTRPCWVTPLLNF